VLTPANTTAQTPGGSKAGKVQEKKAAPQQAQNGAKGRTAAVGGQPQTTGGANTAGQGAKSGIGNFDFVLPSNVDSLTGR
jgi:hypothetical protein